MMCLTLAISISWGLNEDDLSGSSLLLKDCDEAFRDAYAAGIPIFVSSGDQGSGDERFSWYDYSFTRYTEQAHVSYPASSPWVTSVGGTQLYADADRKKRIQGVT